MRFPHSILLTAAVAAALGVCSAQSPDIARPGDATSDSPPAQPPASPGNSDSGAPAGRGNPPAGGGGSKGLFGGDLPFFDAGSDTVTWDGRAWNVSNNRVFEARFEKFLNAPEEDTETDREYNETLRQILTLLSARNVGPSSLDEAFRLLPKASEFEIDSRLCDVIAMQVQSAWQAKRERQRLAAASASLEADRKRLEWNAQMAGRGSMEAPPPRGEIAQREWQRRQQIEHDAKMQPLTMRLAEVNTLLKSNEIKRELTEAQAKLEFQALIVQYFLQRRFRHVLICTSFYRAIFADGQGRMEVGDEAKDFFSRTTGSPPTVSTVDSMANEAIRDVAEGVDAFLYLLEQNELESAAKRLAETFIVGEYLPEIRTLPREKKRRVLEFTQKTNQLISAIEVRDFTLAESLVKDLQTIASDFDSSKPLAVIETAKTVAAMHLAKAKNAAVSGDSETLEAELRAATELWPRNPALVEVSSVIFSQADVQQRALVDFDQLLAQKNFRQIYDDRMRFIAAASLEPSREQQLREVLEKMTLVEGAILRAQEIAKRGDPAGAWESAERAYLSFPDDPKLNQVRADFTTNAAEFVRTLRKAQELESKNQPGSSLAWFLKAQLEYPPSEFAREGIERLVPKILPDAR